MEGKAAFSRLQLAAALIEYDNDDPDPTKPRRSAHDSAIFAHLRRANPRRGTPSRRSTDFLGVTLPSEAGSVYGRDSVVGDRRSKAGSMDALQNPFGRDSTYEGPLDEEEEEEDLEVDLASWGLDTLIPKDKDKGKERRKSKPEVLPNPHARGPSPGPRMRPTANRPTHGARAMSMGNFDSFGEGGAFLESSVDLSERRHSFGSPLDLPVAKTPDFLHQRRRTTSEHVLIENLPVTPPLHSIPFPTGGESDRSVSPLPPIDGPSGARTSSRTSLLDNRHGRTYSTASMGSRALLNEEPSNPFAVRPPSPDRASRFDPKVRTRTMSNGTMGTQGVLSPSAEHSNPFALRPPSPSRASVFDPKARARTVSQGSLGTQMLLGDDDMPEEGERPQRRRLYSRLELMRPKVLIMPSPLQGTMPSSNSTSSTQTREGFEATPDGPPLPPGAKTSRKSSATLSVMELSYAPVASNSFIPNPRQSLSLSQLTFRNTLLVDGQTDVAFNDINSHLRRATQDGDQVVEPEPEIGPESTTPTASMSDPLDRSKRPAGKLYGKSLIDDLEARKAEMHNKRRVFTGDQRPSMMARTSVQRSSTLISPESLIRPISQRMDSSKSQPDLARRNSGMKPLVNFDQEIPGAPPGAFHSIEHAGAGYKKSVFGVDTIWERELAKLKEIEERELQEAAEMKRREGELEAMGGKKKKKKGKKEKRADIPSEPASTADLQAESPQLPPAQSPSFVLPDVPKVTARRGPPPPSADDEDEDEASDSDETPARTQGADLAADDWAADSDEEKGPIRVPGVGPRYPTGPPKLVLSQDIRQDDESSEEDIPLVATIGRAAQRVTRLVSSQAGDESDEDKPLSVVLDKTRLNLPSLGGGSLFPDSEKNAGGDGGDDEDDEKPLGLKLAAGSANPLRANADGDDDLPLGLHPEQMRRTTQYMMAQQQIAQQQMMMQAQMTQSMIFGAPSMMSSAFFGPPIPPPVMIPPQLPSTPPSVPDSVKFGRVDKWRRDVAVEGEQ